MKPDFGTLNRQVVFGESAGRIIWQPRIGCWYEDKKFTNEPLPEPFTDMTLPELYRELGCSARLYEFNECFKRIDPPALKITKRALNETDIECVLETPVGRQVEVIRKSPHSWYHSKVKWEVESEEELKVATWREENTAWEWDQDRYKTLLTSLGDLGAPCMYMPRMNVQSLYLEKMGTERGIYALFDWTDTVEAFFRALDECHDRLIDVINASPVEIINFGENIHAKTLSPDLFLKYHLPACRRRTDRLHEGGKFVYSHWDGDTGPLLPYARDTGMDGIEAITPKPQGDVTLEEIKEGLGDDMFLLDGIPAVYFDETYSVETLEECTRRVIELFAPKLVLGISDEISSKGDIERIRIVGKIVDEYNDRIYRVR